MIDQLQKFAWVAWFLALIYPAYQGFSLGTLHYMQIYCVVAGALVAAVTKFQLPWLASIQSKAVQWFGRFGLIAATLVLAYIGGVLVCGFVRLVSSPHWLDSLLNSQS